jgi:hypothetical protein
MAHEGLPQAVTASRPAAGSADFDIGQLQAELQSHINLNVTRYDTELARATYLEITASGAPAEARNDAGEIIARGTLHGEEVGMQAARKNGTAIINERRWAAVMRTRHPNTLQTLVDQEVAGTHASGSFALAGFIQDGEFYSGWGLHERGKASITGAHDGTPSGNPQRGIAFGSLDQTRHNVEVWGAPSRDLTDAEVVAELQQAIANARNDLATQQAGGRLHTQALARVHNAELALHHFQTQPQTLTSALMRHQFPVVFGVRRSFVQQAEGQRAADYPPLHWGEGDYGEFRVAADAIPSGKGISVIGVPAKEVATTKQVLQQFGRHGVEVVPLEELSAPMPGINMPRQ